MFRCYELSFALNLISFNALSSEISKPPQFRDRDVTEELAGLGDPRGPK